MELSEKGSKKEVGSESDLDDGGGKVSEAERPDAPGNTDAGESSPGDTVWPTITSIKRGPGISLYKGRPGLWAHTLHRITGTALFLFLLIHIADVAAVGWGREAYNTIHKLYETLFFRVMEVGLFGALLFHAINGVRVAIVDFWTEGADRQEAITAWAILAFIVLFVPGATWMLYNFFSKGS